MTGHRKWSEIRNTVLDDPLQRHLRNELRCANDLALQLAELREQRVVPSADRQMGKASLALHETEYLTALREAIAALGGRLEISAVFPDQRVALALQPNPACTEMDR